MPLEWVEAKKIQKYNPNNVVFEDKIPLYYERG